MSPRILTALLCATLSAIHAQEATRTAAPADPMVAAIFAEGLERSKVMEHLDHLTNRIGPRLTSSDRFTQAAEWARDTFQSFGLEARIEPWGEWPVGFNRGPWFGRMIEPTSLHLTFNTPAWRAGTTGRQRGFAMLAPTTAEAVEAQASQFEGRWMVEYPSRGGGRRRGGAEEAEASPEPRIDGTVRRLLDEAYAKAGILGGIRGSNDELLRTSGNWRISWDKLPKIPQITVVRSEWLILEEHLRKGTPVELEFDIRNYFRKGPITNYNVIAEIRGTEKPDEYVVVGGHLDSWDGATGTTDNGTGTSTTIEAARILAAVGAKPKRTIQFMLWGGEEQGLLGSAAYCQARQDEMARTSACFVHDGGTNYVSGIAVTPSQKADFEKIFAPVLLLHPDRPFAIREVPRLSGGASDHGSFLAQGVPGYFWDQAGRSVYGFGWHTQHDTYNIAIPEYQSHTATIVAVAALGTANLPHLISRENMRSTAERPLQNRTLGVQFGDEGPAMAVAEVVAEGAAAKAGVKVGDILLEVDGTLLTDRFALRNAINTGEPKKTLKIKRGTEVLSLELTWTR